MKTLEEIKHEVAGENGRPTWRELLYWDSSLSGFNKPDAIDEVAKRYATEVATQALRDAADNAQILLCSFHGGNGGLDLDKQFEGCCEETYRIDEESIIKVKIKLP